MCGAAKVWNKATEKMETFKTLTKAKQAIREHYKQN